MPTPDNYDVEPLPIPNTSRDIEELSTYVQDINTFLNKINGIEGRSLHQFVNDVDRDGSILEGISDTSSDITKLAELAASLTQTLHSYMTGVNKRRRELAAINNTPR
jgi:methyl-accepting chemotaxis protein